MQDRTKQVFGDFLQTLGTPGPQPSQRAEAQTTPSPDPKNKDEGGPITMPWGQVRTEEQIFDLMQLQKFLEDSGEPALAQLALGMSVGIGWAIGWNKEGPALNRSPLQLLATRMPPCKKPGCDCDRIFKKVSEGMRPGDALAAVEAEKKS